MDKILAFDVDGTLADEDSNIQQGVQSVFKDERIKNCAVIFVTGNTLTTIKRLRKKLLAISNHNLPINSYSATLGGALICDSQNNIVFEKRICKRRLRKILDACVSVDPQSFFLVLQKDKQVFLNITSQAIKEIVLKKLEHINLDKSEIDFNDQNYQQALPKMGRVYEVNIMCPNDVKRVFETVKPLADEAGYFCYCEENLNMVSISSNTKLKALKHIVRCMRSSGEYTKQLKDVVYFGDGMNDLECMRACELSIARGTNLDPQIVKASKFYAEDVTPFLDEIFK